MDGVTQAGGAATISGVVYQILWCLLRAAKIHVEACGGLSAATDGVGASILILEPAGGGGDVRIVGQGELSVEQLKASADGASWSLRSIITDGGIHLTGVTV